ncbi:FimV/HubP family polar landmark protein [Marinicella gelatinilytica]|uniref:FimV/HubP family polar landmark protein n=1 Tax=Marinicella gelatinilytica TaxID=2996017 RepID=UPI002260B6A5|nr:FimV/HubP family polar landmark protein [Marinicella gelatinilytica]MCX7546045.1 hypothetical protein [Marinicella gelatinilytica]
MKHKLIILTLVLSLVFVSQNTLSLGMGKIQVNSALDESLNATINIIANDNESIDQVSVKLASAADYKKVGLDKSFVPGNIMVSVDNDNPYQINVSSNGPVSEPIVSLLLDVSWANGRILREFTLLLDPPSYQASSSGSVSIPTVPSTPETLADVEDDAVTVQSDDIPPVSQDLNEAYEAMDTKTTESDQINKDIVVETPMEENVSDTLSTTPGEVYVAAGDTLWRIANNNKPNNVSTHQMMMAIYNNNPDAFLNNNINQMVKGSTLQMPDADVADDLSYQQALAEFESHNSRWATADDSYSSFQTESQLDDEETVADTTDYGVQLSGGEGDDADSQQTQGDIAESGNSGLSEEDAYNEAREKEELKSRVSELESIVNEQQSVLELQDDDMANLENQMAQDPVESDEAAMLDGDFEDDLMADDSEKSDSTDDVWDAELSDETDVTVEDSEYLADEQDAMSDEEPAQQDSLADVENIENDLDMAEEPATVAPSVTPIKVSEPWYSSAINWIQQNVLWVIIGLVVLFLLILLPRLLNRGDSDPADEGSFLDDIKSSRDEQKHVTADDVELEEDDETILTTPIAVDDDTDEEDFAEDDKTPSLLDEDDDIDDDDVLAELDSSLAFNDDDDDAEDDDLDDFDFGFDDESDDEPVSESTKSVSDDSKDDLLDLDDETPTKEFDPTPFKDNDDFEDDFDLSELDEDTLDEDKDVLADDLVAEDKSDDDDVLDLESELSDLDDEFSIADMDTEEDEDEQDDDFSDDDFLSELDDIEDLDEELTEESTSLDEDTEDGHDFEDSFSLDDDDQVTVFETDSEDDDMDDDAIDLGLDDLMNDGDVIETKLDLAKAYIEMGDTEGAKNLLDEVKAEGNEAQQSEADKLLDDM